MRAELVRTGDLDAVSDKLRKASAKRIEQLAEQVARLAEDNASSPRYNGGKTPGVSYEATAESAGGDFPISVELVAVPESEGADINLRIAIGGRKAYTIYPRFKKALAWPSDRPTRSSNQGKYIHLPRGRPVHKRAIAAVLPKDFLQSALNNAIQRVVNRNR